MLLAAVPPAFCQDPLLCCSSSACCMLWRGGHPGSAISKPQEWFLRARNQLPQHRSTALLPDLFQIKKITAFMHAFNNKKLFS